MDAPCPIPKKSPNGASTQGVLDPSQYIRITTSLSGFGPGRYSLPGGGSVIQMCLMHPAPVMSASTVVFPAGKDIAGRPFRVGPRLLEACPPLPFSPVGFSAVIANDWPSVIS